MKRSNVFGVALLAMLAMPAVTASGARAGAWARPDLVLFSQGTPAPVGETAYAEILVDECAVTTEGTLTANNKPSDTAAFSANVEEGCGKAGYSITGAVNSAKLSSDGTMSFTSTITLNVPGPCNYSITKYSVPFNTNGDEATGGEGKGTARLSKKGSSKSCPKALTASAALLDHKDGLYSTELTSSWWVERKLLVGTEPIAEETKVTVPLKLTFTVNKGSKAVEIECKKEKINNGLIEAPNSRSEEAEIFERCEVVGEDTVCTVASTEPESPPGTITTKALEAKLEGTREAEKLKFVPRSGASIAVFEIKGTSCAEGNSTFKIVGDMICNYEKVGLEKIEHPLEFTATSGSKVRVEEISPEPSSVAAVFEVTDKVHLTSGMPWSAS
jgi:hypothetical protein